MERHLKKIRARKIRHFSFKKAFGFNKIKRKQRVNVSTRQKTEYSTQSPNQDIFQFPGELQVDDMHIDWNQYQNVFGVKPKSNAIEWYSEDGEGQEGITVERRTEEVRENGCEKRQKAISESEAGDGLVIERSEDNTCAGFDNETETNDGKKDDAVFQEIEVDVQNNGLKKIDKQKENESCGKTNQYETQEDAGDKDVERQMLIDNENIERQSVVEYSLEKQVEDGMSNAKDNNADGTEQVITDKNLNHSEVMSGEELPPHIDGNQPHGEWTENSDEKKVADVLSSMKENYSLMSGYQDPREGVEKGDQARSKDMEIAKKNKGDAMVSEVDVRVLIGEDNVAADGPEALKTWIQSGKEGIDAVYSPETLSQVRLDKFENYAWFSDPISYYYPFYTKCLEHKNPHAMYIESLKLGLAAADIHGALAILADIKDIHPVATLAYLILCDCAGIDNFEVYRGFRQKYWRDGDIQVLGEKLMSHIVAIGPRRCGTYLKTWHQELFPECYDYHYYCRHRNQERCSECEYWYLSLAVRDLS